MALEAKEQEIIFSWAKDNTPTYPCLAALYHIPNEGERTRAAGAKLKRQGLKSGIPDICLPYAASGYSSLYIELKTGKNTTTPDQDYFINLLNEIGNRALTVYDADNAITVIKAYLDDTIDSLVSGNTYPADKTKRINPKKFIGFCGEDCRYCNNGGCIDKQIKGLKR